MFILKIDKVLCFDTDSQVFILKGVRGIIIGRGFLVEPCCIGQGYFKTEYTEIAERDLPKGNFGLAGDESMLDGSTRVPDRQVNYIE